MTKIHKRYIHYEDAHNLSDPEIIVPVIVGLISPQSVVDWGCGIGTFLKVFSNHGITEILGIDGSWVDRNLLYKYIDEENFMEADLEKKIILGKKYDLALCLEVAEHLQESAADLLVDNIVNSSDCILFSAAIPGQMGQNHLNEQWPDYWQQKFTSRDYQVLDILRPFFWNNEKVARWYKQNMFLAIKNNTISIDKASISISSNQLLNLVHPEYYSLRVNELKALQIKFDTQLNEKNMILTGKKPIIFYFSLLIRRIITYFRENKK